MQPDKAKELSALANKQIELAGRYEQSRRKAGEAKTDLDILLVTHIKDIRAQKSNVGIEMAYIMLMEIEPTARQIYKTMIEETENYKGLEVLIEAHQSKISLEQSVLRYFREEKY